MAQMSVRVTALALLVALLLLTTLQESQGQTYHYSNGWHSGKKRSGAPALDTPSCSVRPQVLSSIVRILEDELTRIRQSCFLPSFGMGSALPAVMQQLGSSMGERAGEDMPDFK